MSSERENQLPQHEDPIGDTRSLADTVTPLFILRPLFSGAPQYRLLQRAPSPIKIFKEGIVGINQFLGGQKTIEMANSKIEADQFINYFNTTVAPIIYTPEFMQDVIFDEIADLKKEVKNLNKLLNNPVHKHTSYNQTNRKKSQLLLASSGFLSMTSMAGILASHNTFVKAALEYEEWPVRALVMSGIANVLAAALQRTGPSMHRNNANEQDESDNPLLTYAQIWQTAGIICGTVGLAGLLPRAITEKYPSYMMTLCIAGAFSGALWHWHKDYQYKKDWMQRYSAVKKNISLDSFKKNLGHIENMHAISVFTQANDAPQLRQWLTTFCNKPIQTDTMNPLGTLYVHTLLRNTLLDKGEKIVWFKTVVPSKEDREKFFPPKSAMIANAPIELTDNCPICQSALGEDPENENWTESQVLPVRLSCMHCYHTGCIATIEQEEKNCPICRQKFFVLHKEYFE
ncbi:MAG: hypothetical protein WCE21_00245 [Candidatus Babeliales bacterium]